MKPFSIVLSLLLAFCAFGLIVWVGRDGMRLPKLQAEKLPADQPAMAPEDLPMPASGPFGKVEVAEKVFQFGTKMAGETDEHVFKFKNIGEGILEFKLGKPSCQCTLGEITRENGEVITEGPIAPGESVNILVKWKMRAPTEEFRQTVPVFTTDPEQRKIEFAISGTVDVMVRLIPPGIWQIGELSSSEPSIARGDLASLVMDEFTIVEEPGPDSRIKLTWEPIEAEKLEAHHAKSGYSLKAEVDTTGIPIGPYREIVKLKILSKAGEESPVEFSIVGHHTGPIEIRGVAGASFNVDTSRLIFGEFPAEKGKLAKVTFIFKDFDDEIVLNSVEPSDSRVKVTFPDKGTVLGKSKSYRAEFEIPPGPPVKHRRDAAEVLTLKFNHPQAPFFKILVDYQAN